MSSPHAAATGRAAADLEPIVRRRESDREEHRQGERPEPGSKEQEEQQEAKERSAPPGHVLYAAIRREGEDELTRPTSELAWSGLAAGLLMGFSFVLEGILRSHLPDAPWRPSSRSSATHSASC